VVRNASAGDRIATSLLHLGELRVVRVCMASSAVWTEHTTPTRILVHVLRGSILFAEGGHQHRLSSGQLLALGGGIPHSIQAKQESDFQLIISDRGVDSSFVVDSSMQTHTAGRQRRPPWRYSQQTDVS